jgi:hypothetical protein
MCQFPLHLGHHKSWSCKLVCLVLTPISSPIPSDGRNFALPDLLYRLSHSTLYLSFLLIHLPRLSVLFSFSSFPELISFFLDISNILTLISILVDYNFPAQYLLQVDHHGSSRSLRPFPRHSCCLHYLPRFRPSKAYRQPYN